jgi:hypothetical protein
MEHNNDQKSGADYSTFLKQKASMTAPLSPPKRVTRDLVQSKVKLASVYIGGSVLGYLITLVICAQCSIGLTPLAWRTAAMMQNLNETACALVCGTIFGIGPFLASTVALSRFEHRFLLFKMTWLVCLVPVIASVIMTIIGTPHSWTWHGLWASAAIFTPYFLEAMAFLRLKQSPWHGVTKQDSY